MYNLNSHSMVAELSNPFTSSFEVQVEPQFKPLQIGMEHAGGLIFYIDRTGRHGLVCAPEDQGKYKWGKMVVEVPSVSDGLGLGSIYTLRTLLHCSERPIAASVCYELELNGYSDWYLPSSVELSLMIKTLFKSDKASFDRNGRYWSSNQGPKKTAVCMGFSQDDCPSTSRVNAKNLVRAIRRF